MRQLNKNVLAALQSTDRLILPTRAQLDYPEKVLQFGTGVLLRGLPDQYIDDANRSGRFCGRIVVVKSTEKGSVDAFSRQDGLYSVCVKGVHNGDAIDKTIINSSISRVLNAVSDWTSIVEIALSPELEVVISNTTEVGIVSSEDKVPSDAAPPSFPGKLLDLLYKRFVYYKGDPEKGLVIVPAELIEENGTKLKRILNELSEKNNLGNAFISWLNEANHFCNSLVDRIVPGKMEEAQHKERERSLGYTDELIIMAEPFGLWAIESASAKVKEVLTFSDPATGCMIVPSIDKFKEIKLRLLNGTHTFSCGVALLSGLEYVKDAMADPQVSHYIRSLLLEEITPAVVSGEITQAEAIDFAKKVIDRFSNPFIAHRWENIAAQFTSKMKMRNIPLLLQAQSKWGKVPRHMILGFSAYLLCLDTNVDGEASFVPKHVPNSFRLTDAFAATMHQHWAIANRKEVLPAILGNLELWGYDLNQIPGFAAGVEETVELLLKKGIRSVF